jgi:hypothetical protein
MLRAHLAATGRLGHAERPRSRIVLVTLLDDPADGFQQGERAVPGDIVFPSGYWRVGGRSRRCRFFSDGVGACSRLRLDVGILAPIAVVVPPSALPLNALRKR